MMGEGDVKRLIEAARAARKNAYAPYSRFAVGAAVRLTNGDVIVGANFENASYGLSLCAETVALAAANAQGRIIDVVAIAVVGGDSAPITPCGRCRQILAEAEQVAGRRIAVYCAASSGDSVVEHSIAELLPFSFGPNDLGLDPYSKS
ncbi:cytidine deaminase [Sphingobium herbicidovorans]|nr:cytidine deaminase [Sphingobium herbicidovorans]